MSRTVINSMHRKWTYIFWINATLPYYAVVCSARTLQHNVSMATLNYRRKNNPFNTALIWRKQFSMEDYCWSFFLVCFYVYIMTHFPSVFEWMRFKRHPEKKDKKVYEYALIIKLQKNPYVPWSEKTHTQIADERERAREIFNRSQVLCTAH